MIRQASVWLCFAVGLGGPTAAAQMPFVQADRPGEATPPHLVPSGTIQLEAGTEFRRETGDDDHPDTGTLTLPEILLRFGVLDWLELRLEADGLLYQLRDGTSNRALGSDLTLAAKVGLPELPRFFPQTSALLALSLPVGSKAATSDGVDPTLDALYQWDLDDSTAVVVNTGFSWPSQGSDDDRRIFQFGPQIAIERRLAENLGAFFEYFGKIKTRGFADEHSLDGGFSLRIAKRRLQLDLSGGGGLNQAAPDWFVRAGVAIRFSAPWAR